LLLVPSSSLASDKPSSSRSTTVLDTRSSQKVMPEKLTKPLSTLAAALSPNIFTPPSWV